MKQVYRFDENGFYIEPVIMNDNELTPIDCTDIKPEDGMYRACFKNGLWIETISQDDLLIDLKATKKAQLSQLCNETIAGGFTSSALGVAHTYPSHTQAQTNFNTEMHRFVTDSTYTSCKFFTEDAGYLEHTKDQFFKVFNEGHDFGNVQWDKLFQLYPKVDTAQTQDDLNAITW